MRHRSQARSTSGLNQVQGIVAVHWATAQIRRIELWESQLYTFYFAE